MRKILLSLIFVSLIGGFLINPVLVSAQNQNPNPEITLFYSAYCPHCKDEKEFLATLKEKYPEVIITEYEIAKNADNQKILAEFYEKYNVPKNEQGWVPITFTPTKYLVGFNDQVAREIENCLQECLGEHVVAQQKIKIPIFGEINIADLSLPVLTILLGILDGFNPCAMWVLVILISLVLSLKSRKKIALVGGTFILAGGFLYFLIMAAWLNVFLAFGYISLIRILIGFFGIGFGIWRIRDFINWRPGVCKVVKNVESQQKVIDKIKNALKPSAVPATILGVIGLAFGVNLIEFLCSAGFPAIFTRILSLQNLATWQYYSYLVFYNIFYMLDDFIVFGIAFFTLSRFNFSDKYNKWSTLAAGLLIFVLGILLIFRPEILMFG
ncbi:glutaredoxin [Patescibacteria group bacterium]|nr:glutaredoxin [Patescibacteria group bacterium]MBU4462006.1 glutaredoxin [Patescibacteria group bacterium]MCG2700197.1 glutaredoxin [Candidatus Parcubacteria bacterium]